MYLKIKNKKIDIIELTKFSERFKGLKFVLEKLDYGVYFPNKRWISTNFLCQNIDIALTDKNNIIISLMENVRSEKYIFKFRTKNIYFLPLDTVKYLQIGKKIPVTKD